MYLFTCSFTVCLPHHSQNIVPWRQCKDSAYLLRTTAIKFRQHAVDLRPMDDIGSVTEVTKFHHKNCTRQMGMKQKLRRNRLHGACQIRVNDFVTSFILGGSAVNETNGPSRLKPCHMIDNLDRYLAWRSIIVVNCCEVSPHPCFSKKKVLSIHRSLFLSLFIWYAHYFPNSNATNSR